MNHSEDRAPKPSPSTGSLAQLRAFLRRAPGCGVHSNAAHSHPHLAPTGSLPALAGPRRLAACRFIPRRPLILALAIASFFALTAAPAFARETYLEGVNGEPPTFGTGSEPRGIALDQATGDMYVSVGGNTVEKFNEGGDPENFSHLGTNQLSPGGSFVSVAVDNSSEVSDPSKGDLYVDNSGNGVIEKYNEAGELLASIPAPAGAEGIAVDSSGNLYVASNSEGTVLGFSPSGTPLNSGHPVLEVPGTNPFGLAFNSNGDLYVTLSDGGRGAVEFKPEGGTFNPTPIKELPGDEEIPGTGRGSYAITVDQKTNDVFVSYLKPENWGAVKEFNEHGEEIETLRHLSTQKNEEGHSQPEFYVVFGLAVNEAHPTVNVSSYYFNTVDVFHLYHKGSIELTNVGYGSVTASPVGIETGIERCESACEAEYEEGSTVTLTASPIRHSELSHWEGCTHESGLTCEVTIGSGVTPVKAVFSLNEHALTITEAGTGSGEVKCGAGACAPTYLDGSYLTLTAVPALHSKFTGWSGACTNSSGPCVIGHLTADAALAATFAQDEPAISLEGATAIGQRGATLSAQVNPEGATTTCRFEYGTTTLYGAEAPCASNPGPGATSVGVSATLGGLAPRTTYFFRLNATNSGGTTYGEGETFTTAAPETCATNASLCESISNKFTIGAAKPHGSAIALEVILPGPGEVIASGKDLEGANVSSLAAGAVSLNLKLTGAGQKALKKAKGHKLKAKVKLTYTPTAAAAGSATTTVVFKAAGGKR